MNQDYNQFTTAHEGKGAPHYKNTPSVWLLIPGIAGIILLSFGGGVWSLLLGLSLLMFAMGYALLIRYR